MSFFKRYTLILLLLNSFHLFGQSSENDSSLKLLNCLQVNDFSNTVDWSLESNISVGKEQFNDRDYTITSLPQWAEDLEWIKVANDSKSYTASDLATFSLANNSTIYIAHQDVITSKPSWLADWEDTGDNLANSNGSVFSLFKKTFSANTTVTLGANGDIERGMYSVLVAPNSINNLEVNDLSNIVDWSIAFHISAGKEQFNDRDYTITSLPQWAEGLEWIKVANDSKSYTTSDLATFSLTNNSTIYIAHQDVITSKPSWLADWEDTGDNLANSNGSVFSIFKKSFPANATITLGPNGDTGNGMYSVLVSPNLLSELQVFDNANSANWNLESNLSIGDKQFNDRNFTITSLPQWAEGLEWIKTANNSKNFTSSSLVEFSVSSGANIYVAHQDNISTKPSWLTDWEDTGDNMSNSNGKVFSLFKKSFPANATITLGSNGDTANGMYTILGDFGDCVSDPNSDPNEVYQASGVKVGEVDNSSAIVWTRKTLNGSRDGDGYAPGAAGLIRVLYGQQADLSDAVNTNWVSVSSNTDFSHKFQLTGLESNSTYYYAVYTAEANGVEHQPMFGTFKTAPDEDACENISFTMMTCMRYDQRDLEEGVKIFDEMAALNPDFAIEAGDLIYYDQHILAQNVTDARRKWERMYSLPNLVDFHQNVPVYYLKDDHDVLKNDAWPGQTYGDLTFQQGVDIFNEQLPMGPLPYRTRKWGNNVQLWFMEGRDYRDPNPAPDGPDKSIWGETQKQWFKNSVLASDAKWKILVSPTPIVGPDKPNKIDNHVNNGWQFEGNEIREWIRDNVGDDMIILCGDRHWQYHSIHPETGIHEFSVGSSTDERSGGSPGFNANFHQYHKVVGGFVEVEVESDSDQTILNVNFYDTDGTLNYNYSRQKNVTCGGESTSQNCTIDLSEAPVELITGQGTSTGTINEGGYGITVNGNGWNAMQFPQTISAETVLSFEFKSTQQGEEHSIGFANSILPNNVVNGTRFKLYGTQNVSNADANQSFSYSGSGEWQTFTIPVGEFFTGDFEYLVFVNDNDAVPNTGNSSFRNIKIVPNDECEEFETTVSDCTIDLSLGTIELITGQGTSTGTINEGGYGITVNGNGWNAMQFPQTISAETVLSFEFKSTQQGEEHSIGFANSILPNNVVNGTRFKLYGTQNVSNADANQSFSYSGSGEWQTFTIPVGEFFTGDFEYLVFVNDNDAVPNTGNSSFRNIEIVPNDECEEFETTVSDCTIDLSLGTIELITGQGTSTGTINEGGYGITVNGNGWNAMQFPQTISAETVLSFEFKSTQQGEEHSIGFANSILPNNVVNGTRFKLYGTQNVSNADANQSFSYSGNGDWQTFTIPVGEFFTGDFEYIVFVNDNDAVPNTGNSSFRNIEIVPNDECEEFETTVSDCTIDLSLGTIELITGQGTSTGTINEGGYGITVNGNGWNAMQFPQTISAETVLSFEFKSIQQGEEHSIGFANSIVPNNVVNGTRFKLHGTQNVSNADANQSFSYSGSGEWQTFTIPVGEFFTGNFEYLVFVNDIDAAANTSNSSFRNIEIITGTNCLTEPTTGTPSIDYAFNFAPAAVNTPAPFIEDNGQAYGTKANGLSYGWVLASNNNPSSQTQFTRNRATDTEADLIRSTLIHMNFLGTTPNAKWEVEVPNGIYRIVVMGGDRNTEGVANTRHLIKAEGTTVIDFSPGDDGFGLRTGVATVTVNDGKLTLDGSDGFNAKISAVAIQSTDGLQYPAIIGSLPLDGATNVSLNTSISANFISLLNVSSNGATSLDNSSLNDNTVKLFKLVDDTPIAVPVAINGTGGGDAINMTVAGGLEANTRYRYMINGAKDLAGATVFPFAAEFITGEENNNPGGGSVGDVSFTNVGNQASGFYASLTVGPDGKLYGLRISGQIDRWTMNADGTLSDQQTLEGLNNAFGGNDRLAIGLSFAPNATATNLIAYVSHSAFTFSGGPEWDGKISRLTGNNLQNHQLILTNLPRSVRDHLTNSIVFDPNNENIMYFNQGSNSAGGAADNPWGNRPERLLTAATLRLDLNLLPNNLPLDVQTTDNINVINTAPTNSITMSDGTYNPYANNSPLTIAGSGIRNPYDLVFHSNGQIYIPTNGTAGGSNSPASIQGVRRPNGDFYNGPTIPSVTGNSTQRDFLFRINPNDNNIGYFGHPNILRGEFVLNNGAASTSAYPSDIQPDVNYQGFAFDFEFNKSPNGVIEYKSAGALQGAIIVCRYSNGDDLIVLYPDGPNGDVATSVINITGFNGFNDPLDLVEDPNTGNIYISEYGGSGSITLLRLENPGTFTEGTNEGITVSFSTPANNQNFDENESIGVVVNAADSNGSITNVQLFLDNVLVRQENGAPYEWGAANSTSVDPLLENLAAGTYTLKAIATDNQGNTAETNITISVGNGGNGISLSFAAPENNDVYNEGESLGVVVNAADANGSISNVQLFLNNTLVRQENYAPYEWGIVNSNSADPLLENLVAGTYTLKAVAMDNQGNVEEKSITITVIGGQRIYVENMRKVPNTDEAFPYDDRVVFHRATTTNENILFSEYSTIRLNNTGNNSLTINSMEISNTDFVFEDYTEGQSFDIAPGEFRDVALHFVTDSGEKRIIETELTINSNDPILPVSTVELAGGYMAGIGGSSELNSQQMIDVLGFNTNISNGINFTSAYPTPEEVASGEHGDIVVSPFWEQADDNEPVTMFYLSSFKGANPANSRLIDQDGVVIEGFSFSFATGWYQSIFPRGSSDVNADLLSRVGDIDVPFAINLATRDTRGSGGINPDTGLPILLGVKVYQVIDRDGSIRPNEYIAIMDYTSNESCLLNGGGICDYNDNAIYLRNIRPVTTSTLQATLYDNCEYDGNSISLGIGEYPNMLSIGISNDDISSLRVPAGLQVTLFDSTDFGGSSIAFTADDPCLINNNFNDETSSIKIEAIDLELIEVLSNEVQDEECSSVSTSTTDNAITVTSPTDDDILVVINVYDSSWSHTYRCGEDECQRPVETIPLEPDTYFVTIQHFTKNGVPLCEKITQVTVGESNRGKSNLSQAELEKLHDLISATPPNTQKDKVKLELPADVLSTLQIAPNPAKNHLTITSPVKRGNTYNLVVIDPFSRVMHEEQITSETDILSIEFNSSSWEGGLYYILLEGPSNVLAQQLIIVK